MHFSIRHPRVITGIRAAQYLDPEGSRPLQHIHKTVHISLHPVQVDLNLFLSNFTTEFQHPFDKGYCRHDSYARFGDGFEIGFGREIGMHDPINAGLRRGARRGGTS